MKLVTRDTDYAIRALMFIACRRPELVTTEVLSENLKIPRPFLRKILQVLNKKGMLKSYKGQGGGFRLKKPLGGIFLIDLMEIFQGQIVLNECILNKKNCPNVKVCKLKKKLDKIQDYVVSELRNISLASLLK